MKQPSANAETPSDRSPISAATLAGLRDPHAPDERAPERFTIVLDTTKGTLHVDVRRSWAPYGTDRLYTLVKRGFFDDVAFFRVVEGFAAQTGLHGDPTVNEAWSRRSIPDDPPTQSNLRGMLSFASRGKNTRTTQVFINLVDNPQLDGMGFAPVGRVRELALLDKLYAGYGESMPAGRGPIQRRIEREGNTYLRAEFPELDYIKHASLVDEHAQAAPSPMKPLLQRRSKPN